MKFIKGITRLLEGLLKWLVLLICLSPLAVVFVALFYGVHNSILAMLYLDWQVIKVIGIVSTVMILWVATFQSKGDK